MPTISVAAGCVSAPMAAPARSIVTVTPAAGATAVLEYTAGSASDVANGVAQWSSWPKGASTSQQQDIINEPAFLRLTATGGSATLTTEESPTILARENFNSDWGGSKRYPFILAQSASPIILLPAGVWNNTTGQMAVGTALPYLPTGTVKVYLFASGIAQAGLYDATFTGSAAAPVMQLAGNPTTVAGAYTPTLNQSVTLASVTLPGGAMGPNGGLRRAENWSYPNNANTKTFGVAIGGQQLYSQSPTTTASMGVLPTTIRNRGNQAIQHWPGSTIMAGNLASGTSAQQYAINTAADQAITFTANLGAGGAADYVILEGYTIEVLPG